eukprot:4687281-Pleurochrysis_carterae.AAC.1
MMYKWGHPVATTLLSDGGDYTSLSLNGVNSANDHPFPGHEITLPGFDPNHFSYQQPHDVGHAKRCSPCQYQWRLRAPSAVGVRRVISFKLIHARVEYAR